MRDETQPEGNTAPKVGQLLYDLVVNAVLRWDPGAAYTLNDYVSYNGIFYRALGNVPAGKTPDLFPNLWADDIARLVEQVDADAPDRLISQRAVVAYVTQRLNQFITDGVQVEIPSATEEVAGISKRASKETATADNTVDYISPSLALELIQTYLDEQTLGTVTKAGNVTYTNIVANGGVSAYDWMNATGTISQVFVSQYVEGKGYCLAELSLAQLASLLNPLLSPDNPGGGNTGGGTGGGTTTPLPAYIPVQIWRATVDEATTAPAAPSNLQVALTNDGRYIATFQDNSSNETAFQLERAIGDGAFESYVQLPYNQTTSGFLPDIQSSLTYRFRMVAVNAGGRSGPSNIATLAPLAPAPTPPVIAAKSNVRSAALSVTLPPFSDPLGRTVTYTATGLPAGLSFDPLTRIISGTPTTAATFGIAYTGTAGGRSASMSFLWTITPPATLPRIAQVGARLSNSSLLIEAIPTIADAIEWEIISGGENYYPTGWFEFGYFPQDGPYTLRHNYFTGSVPVNSELVFRARCKSNPTAIAGPFSAPYGGSDYAPWTMPVNPS
ncbi:putative Ig domain-containing protein [Fibrella sp. ES10-3-2-2]|nr:hypothetical protein A6C57_01040 [Fibrella sp. ES10-3-2-2]